MGSRFLSKVAVVVVLAAAGPAAADDSEIDPRTRAKAELLFREGSELFDAGSTKEACPKLQAAVDLTKGEALGGKLMLARCYEKLGRTATAWGLYNEVAGRAAAVGQKERATEAAKGAEGLATQIHFLEIAIPESTRSLRGLAVSIDGRVQPRAAWEGRLPVDPGSADVTISADGKVPQTKTMTIPSSPGTSRLAFDAPLADAPTTDRGPRREGKPAEARTEFWSPVRVAGLSVAVVGGASVIVGAVLGAVAKSNYDDALVEGGCSGSPPVCHDAGPAEDARALGDAATGVFFAGVGLSAIGFVMFAAAPSTPVEASEPAAALTVGPFGFRLRTTF